MKLNKKIKSVAGICLVLLAMSSAMYMAYFSFTCWSKNRRNEELVLCIMQKNYIRATELVRQGADANLPYILPARRSFMEILLTDLHLNKPETDASSTLPATTILEEVIWRSYPPKESAPVLMLGAELIRYGANWNIVSITSDRSDDPSLAQLCFETSLNVLCRALLSRGFNPNIKFKDGSSPLSRAIANNNVEMVRELLEAHADPHIADSDHDRDFIYKYAKRIGNKAIIECIRLYR